MNRTAAPATTPSMMSALAASTPPPESLLELDPVDPPPSVGAVGLIGEVGVEVEGLGGGRRGKGSSGHWRGSWRGLLCRPWRRKATRRFWRRRRHPRVCGRHLGRFVGIYCTHRNAK